MRAIIIPVNFSACSDNAARYAADLAQAIRVDLHLIHVIETPTTAAESANNSLKELQFDLRRRTCHSIKVETRMEVGSVTAKMKELCQEIQPYAVVLGASGPTLEKLLTGSPISSLLHKLNYPVLVIPDGVTFHQFRRVLLA